MQILEGSIAFALALAGFATICTMLIELLHRVAGWRSDGLKTMLEAYFDDIIKPRMTQAAQREIDTLRADFMSRVRDNPLLEKIKDTGVFAPLRKRLLTADKVTTEEFLARLPDTQLFEKIEREAGQTAAVLIKQLADKYDQFGAGATDYFKRRSQLLSIVVGILLALFANIHAIRLFDSFIKDPDLALKMQAQAEVIKQTIDQQKQSAPGQVTGTRPGDELAESKAQLDKAMNTLQSYQDIGLPIGWDFYPNCFGSATVTSTDSRCKAIVDAAGEWAKSSNNAIRILYTLAVDPMAGLAWFFTVVLTGFLIGLGGPFWYDLAMRLSQVKQAFAGKATASPVDGQSSIASAREAAVSNAAARMTIPPPKPGE